MLKIDSAIALDLATLGLFSDEPKEKKVEEYLEGVANQDDDDDQVLVFDPETGDLVVQKKKDKKPSPDSVVATSIARDGFFVEKQ